MSEQQARYNGVAMAIHWLTALTVIGLLIVGNYMADLPKTDPMKLVLFNIHKSFGVAVFLLTALRLVWRLTHRPPELPSEMPAWEQKAAHAAHWALYALLFIVPLMGWLMVSESPRNIPTMLFGMVQLPHLPFFADWETDQKRQYKELFETLHSGPAYLMAVLIVAHIGAALRHRLILKDKVVQRMLPKIIPALLIGLLAVGVSRAEAADWKVDPAKSKLGFQGSLSGQSFEGTFKKWEAEIAFDPAKPAEGHAKVTIDMASAVTGDKQRDAALPDSDWFSVKKFPQAVFEATKFIVKDATHFDAEGSLTIRGNAKPVTMPFTLEIAGDSAHAVGKLDIVRSDFGVGQGEWADGAMVALKVGIFFDLTAAKK
jgi:cytochrome b561/polyisoprenoid-binding protein YceI